MKALILVGGYGTRLRPLTLSIPKPLIQFCNKPIVEYQIEALAKVGVKRVILAVAYKPDAMKDALAAFESKYNVEMVCSVEDEPLGTAGPIRLAEKLIMEDMPGESDPDILFVLNSDVICEYPMSSLVTFHKEHQKSGTLLVAKVKNPSVFGVVVHDQASGKIHEFVEKPKEFVGDWINAGLYVFDRKIISLIESRPTSIEKETFPLMASTGDLYCYRLGGYWADIGQPKDYLSGCVSYLKSLEGKCVDSDGSGTEDRLEILESKKAGRIIGNVLIHPSAKIDPTAVIGPSVTIGPNCVIGPYVRIKNCAVLDHCTMKSGCYVEGSIIGWNCRLGKWTRIQGLTVLGQEVVVNDECLVNAGFVLPNKTITESITEPGKVVM